MTLCRRHLQATLLLKRMTTSLSPRRIQRMMALFLLSLLLWINPSFFWPRRQILQLKKPKTFLPRATTSHKTPRPLEPCFLFPCCKFNLIFEQCFNPFCFLGSVCKTLFYLWHVIFVAFNMCVCSSLALVNPSVFFFTWEFCFVCSKLAHLWDNKFYNRLVYFVG